MAVPHLTSVFYVCLCKSDLLSNEQPYLLVTSAQTAATEHVRAKSAGDSFDVGDSGATFKETPLAK